MTAARGSLSSSRNGSFIGLKSPGAQSSTTRSFLLSLLILGVIPLTKAARLYRQEGSQPLPELTSFVQEVRKNLRSDRMLLSHYTYLEKDTELRLDSNGNAVKTEVKVYEIYPALEQAQTYRKLISKNGRALPRDELERQDRDYEAKIQGRTRQGQMEGSDARKRRAAEAKARRKDEEVIDEVFHLYQISMVGRETLTGRPAIVLEFKPRPGFLPKTDPGRMLKKMEGRAWINEQDRQLVRVEARLIDTISFGLGLLARFQRGSRVLYERRRVNDEIWLPAEYRFAGAGRLFLLKKVRIDAREEYSDYKKFSVETSVSYSRDKKPR